MYRSRASGGRCSSADTRPTRSPTTNSSCSAASAISPAPGTCPPVDRRARADPRIEGGPRDQVAEPQLDERPEVARRAVGEFHDAAGLAVDEDDVAAANVGCLHKTVLPEMKMARAIDWRRR